MSCSAANQRAPIDGIPPEVFKTGGQTLILKLTEFLCTCWEDGCLPKDLKGSRIVHLYKGKGDKSSCDNYREISLFSIAGKSEDPLQGHLEQVGYPSP